MVQSPAAVPQSDACVYSKHGERVNALFVCHVGWDRISPGYHPLVVHFMKGALRIRPPCEIMVPKWNLALVLDDLCDTHFEPLESIGLI